MLVKLNRDPTEDKEHKSTTTTNHPKCDGKERNDKKLDIFEAAECGDTVTLQNSINSGVNVNVTNEFKLTPLYNAVLKDQAKPVEILLKNGADPAILCRSGLTGLHIASENGNVEILGMLARRLHESNASINLVNDNKSSLIHSTVIGIKAGNNKCWATLEFLLKSKEVDPFLENDRRQTPRDILENFDYPFAEKFDDRSLRVLFRKF